MSENNDKRTATQRIEDLEKVVTSLYQGLNELMNTVQGLLRLENDMALVKEALKLLNKKTEAIIQTAKPETGITVESVSALVVRLNVADLANQVTGYVENKQIVTSDVVAADSFLVCEEVNSEGVVANPRIQFRVDTTEKSVQDALMGKKVGDLVSFGENKLDVRILEVYSLTVPKADAATEAPKVEAAPEAPVEAAATEQPATDEAPATEQAPPAEPTATETVTA